MTAQNLVEYSKGLQPGVEKAVVELYAQSSDLLAAVPWKTTGGAYQYTLEATLPGIAYRGVNESYTPDTSVENPQVEQVFIAGGEADVDNYLLALDPGRRAREESRKIKQMARAVTSALITGDNSTNPKSPDGLQRRLTGRAVIANSAASGGAALSLAALDEAIANTVDPTHILLPFALRTKFGATMRNQTLSGNLNLTKDDFGREVMTYNGLPFLVGYETGPDTALLPFTETASGGGSAVTSSIYVMSLKEGHICGIQVAPMSVKDLGELQSEPKHRTRIEWFNSFCIENPYAATRLTSITNAAIVA